MSILKYYNTATSQWEPAMVAGQGPQGIQGPQGNNGAQSPNYLINGAFDIWQRGTTFTSTSYTADRWYSPITNATVSQETSDLPTGFRYGAKIVLTGTGFSQFNQPIERDTVISLRGKTVTVSGYVKISGALSGNWQVQAYYSTSTDAYASLTTLVPNSTKTVATAATTTWTRFSHTFVVPVDAVGMRIENLPDVQSAAGATIRLTGIQLEEGSVATAFHRNAPSIQAELAACQRYYQRFSGGVGCGLFGASISSTSILGSFNLPVIMRAIPGATASGSIWVSDYYTKDFEATSATIAAQQGFNTNGGCILLSGFSNLVIGRWYSAPGASIGSGYIDFSAEL